MKTTYCLQVHQSHDTAIMVSLNDVPVYDRVLGNEARGTTSSPDQWLFPGENTISLTMKRGEVGPTTAISTILRDAVTNVKLATLTWPDDFATPDDPAPLGTRTALFELPATHGRPIFMDAPRPILPREGNAAAWAPLEAIVAAFRAGDADGVYEAIRLKAEEHHRFHDVDESSPATVRRVVGQRVQEPYAMQPLDREITVFEPAAGGRLHRVTRLDGRPVILGYPAAAKAPVYSMNPFLVFTGDSYRILF
ncbi:MAG: hypothetical protein HUU21_10165 [Polyangiaceae bacterium]|nr:hypothetical protein [Polyangiaceae bacterium]